ncbi:MAG: hypothetical protein KME31_11840 [Tolypothrix carrinoi HA7290-LM1]|nr:hypothetical protein [Tolypothrix carrinoi HA7290-LM1]
MGHGAWGMGHREREKLLPITYYLLPMPIAQLPFSPTINKELLQSITRSQHDPGRSVTMP